MQNSAIEIVTHDLTGKTFTAESFLEYLRPSHDRWHEVRNYSEPKVPMYDVRSQWAFRGHWSSSDWKLVPSAWRYETMKNHVELSIELGKQNFVFETQERDYWEFLRQTEASLLFSFYESLIEFGHPVPAETIDPRLVPREHLHNDNRLIELVGLAQHHGIPTRFLDWTLNPLAAAYFASAKHLRKGDSNEICIWCLNVKSPFVLDEIGMRTSFPEKVCIKIVKQAPHTNSYLRAQEGLFTVTTKGQFFEKNGPDLEAVVSDAAQALDQREASFAFPVLRKVVLQRFEVDRLLVLLEREGYSRSLLMPTLDNLAKDALQRSLTRGQ